MENLKGTGLNKPEIETWFIGWNNNRTEIHTYGSVTPTQTMDSPWNEMDFYEDEQIWLEVLNNNNIYPFLESDEQNEL
jgi:hypothetical protein